MSNENNVNQEEATIQVAQNVLHEVDVPLAITDLRLMYKAFIQSDFGDDKEVRTSVNQTQQTLEEFLEALIKVYPELISSNAA